MARKSTPKPNRQPDLSLLSEEELAALRAEAEDQVLAERQAEAREAAIEKFVEEARRATSDDPDDEMVEVFIDVPEYTDRLIIDGTHYMFGRTYTVSRAQANSMQEMMGRAIDHQQEIDGKSRFMNKKRDMIVSPKGIRAGA